MVEPLNLKFSVFTVKLVSVRKFRNFTVMSLSTFYLYIQDNRRICLYTSGKIRSITISSHIYLGLSSFMIT